MCGFDSDFFPECKSKSISGGFIHQAGIFGVKCFSIFCGLILTDSKSGEILMPNDLMTSEEEAQLPRPPLAFDSHCHIDRILTDCHLARSASIQEICSQERPDKDHVVSLEGLITSYCDPETYPTPEEVRAIVSQGCYVVVGLHPKKEASERDWETLHNLLQLPEVSGLGEIGVDHTMPISTWTDQTNKIDGAIRSADNLPRIVVLHCRGVQNEDNTEAYNLLLKTLSLRLGGGALFHLHCFSGSSRIVDMWLETFPNTYFSFTKMVGGFTGDCARAVRKLHVGRLHRDRCALFSF